MPAVIALSRMRRDPALARSGGLARIKAGLLLAFASCASACARDLNAQIVRQQDVVLRVGTQDGSASETFGAIVDVGADQEGNIFVVDRQALELRWFDASGTYRGTASRKGQGPGELLKPGQMHVSSSGTVHVLDLANRRISRFRVHERALRHERDVALGFRVTGFCLLGNRLFTTGALGRSAFIQEVDTSGAIVRSFGSLEQPEAGLAERLGAAGFAIQRDRINYARLHCDEAAGRIYALHWDVGVVRSYDAHGRLVWRAQIDGFHPADIGPTPDRVGLAVRFNPRTKSMSSGAGMTGSPGGNLFVSVRTISAGEEESWIDLRELRFADGREVSAMRGQDTLAAVVSGFAFGYHENPFPQVVKYRITP